VDLAVLAVPEEFVEQVIRDCSRKKVKGITIITAGFRETSELGLKKQKALASMRNPVDFGASGLFLSVDTPLALSRKILSSGEVDALIMHGIGRPEKHTKDPPDEWKVFLDIQKQEILGLNDLEKKTSIPVLIGSHYSPWESQVIWDLNKQGIRIYNNLYETAQLLSFMYDYWGRRSQSLTF